MNKNIFLKIAELMELANEVTSSVDESAMITYFAKTRTVQLNIFNAEHKTIYMDTCYLDWEVDCSKGIDIMFPEFREKLQMMLREKAVC